MTLIFVNPSGTVTYSNMVSGKELIVESYKEGECLLMLAWTGQYRTDIFLITKDDLDKMWSK